MIKKSEQEEIKDITKQILESSKKEIKKEEIELIYSGCDVFDLITGGHPVGGMVNLVGNASSGKTFISLEILASFYRQYLKNARWVYDDAESGFTFTSEEMKDLFGIDAFKYTTKTSETVEEMSFNLDNKLNKLKENQYLLYIVDSLDGLSCKAEQDRREEAKKLYEKEKDYNIGSYQMEKQKFMSEFFRVFANKMKNKNCTQIIISQVRSNVGVMFGKKYKKSGGLSVDFYANQIIWLNEAEKITKTVTTITGDKETRTIGTTIHVKITKNKNAKPFREGFIRLYFDYGIDNITTNLLYLYNLLSDKGKDRTTVKTILEWDGKEYKFDALISYIEENNLEDELSRRVKEKWNDVENQISIIDKRKKRF